MSLHQRHYGARAHSELSGIRLVPDKSNQDRRNDRSRGMECGFTNTEGAEIE